jgi:hypothetical protein
MKTSAEFLTTLRRIPDDVILSMATRGIDLPDAWTCVCGWAAREVVARQRNVDAEDVDGIFVTRVLAQELGGSEDKEWRPINIAWCYSDQPDALEEAFVDRVAECVT